MQVSDLKTPSLLLDRAVLERNLTRMQEQARRLRVSLRPHLKSHKCAEIGKRQLELGAHGVTVATLTEARLFIERGFADLTWAVPIPPVHAAEAWELSRKATLRVLVDGPEAIEALEKAGEGAEGKLHVWLKIDCGYHRVGVDPASPRAEELVGKLNDSPCLVFDGILSHSGHAYDVRSRDEAKAIARSERDVMVGFAERMRGAGREVPAVSVGSTPALCAAEDLEGVTEIRPGNYALFDATQVALGTCERADCAVSVLASVISHQPGAKNFVVDAGALSLSKDPGPTHLDGAGTFGAVLHGMSGSEILPGLHVTSLSQEHGKVMADEPARIEGRFPVGEKIRILEHHSCLTVAMFDEFVVVEGEEVVDRWRVLRDR